MQKLIKYFPDLSEQQIKLFEQLLPLYTDWNSKINVISRKDIEHLYEHHVLHSLAIAKVISFKPGTKILDVGTGGGFPGIPLAILFPECSFHLIDSIGKKIKVVEEVVKELGLQNVVPEKARAEELKTRYDFVVSRAVTSLPEFYNWVQSKIMIKNTNTLQNGILYLKGGDLKDELKPFKKRNEVFEISNFFEEEFFLEKKVIHIFKFL